MMFKFLYKGYYGFSDKSGCIIYTPQFQNVYKLTKGWGCLLESKWTIYDDSTSFLIIKNAVFNKSQILDSFTVKEKTLIRCKEKNFIEWLFLDDSGKKNDNTSLGFIEPFHFGLAISYNICDYAKKQFLISETGDVKFGTEDIKKIIGSDFSEYFFERYLFNLISVVTRKNNSRHEYLFQYGSDLKLELIKSGSYFPDKIFHYRSYEINPFDERRPLIDKILRHK